ncbi:sigma-70 family RNA polymerase sigma factor [Nocardioides ultimimeridianus]
MSTSSRGGAAELAVLLRRSAKRDTAAFARFYDLTCARVLAYELARAQAGGRCCGPIHEIAEQAARDRYVAAWAAAAEHATSGRSPLAWLIALDVPTARVDVRSEIAVAS